MGLHYDMKRADSMSWSHSVIKLAVLIREHISSRTLKS